MTVKSAFQSHTCLMARRESPKTGRTFVLPSGSRQEAGKSLQAVRGEPPSDHRKAHSGFGRRDREWGQAMTMHRINIQPALDAAASLSRAMQGIRPPRRLVQPIPSSFRKCAWCSDHLPIFGPTSVDLGDGWAHQECAHKSQRFVLKSSIRHRTNPTTGYFRGWRTP